MKPLHFTTELDFAVEADAVDPLNGFRNQFYFSDEKTIYLDGNSLGRLPVETKKLLTEVTENQWGTELIESWNRHWYKKSGKLGNKIARLTGASEGEIIVCDSTSVNLFKLAYAALKHQKGKHTIVSDTFNFPTDLYVLQGLLKQFGPDYMLILAKSKDGVSMDLSDLEKKITKNTAIVVLSMVAFKSSYLYDAKKITDMVHQKGALILWDLSHAAGAIPVELNNINADMAVGCTYKYLNGGPGSPAFLYVRKDLQEKLATPIQGWFGDTNPFDFDLNYRPAEGIRKFLTGTPPVISQMAIEPGLDILLEAGMEKIHAKSIRQTDYFIFLASTFLSGMGFTIGSPLNNYQRGSHITLKHDEGYRICRALINPVHSRFKIIPDFREPDNIRFGIAPLYTSYKDIWHTVLRLKEIINNNEFERFPKNKDLVT